MKLITLERHLLGRGRKEGEIGRTWPRELPLSLWARREAIDALIEELVSGFCCGIDSEAAATDEYCG